MDGGNMVEKLIKKFVENKLALADVNLDGCRPWDIQVRDNRFYRNVATQGSLGMGESYMLGWIEAPKLDETIYRIFSSQLINHYNPNWIVFFYRMSAMIFNKQSKTRAYEVGRRHYDIGNDLFQKMLDKRLTYSCGYWQNAKNLDEAQEAKLDLICRKLMLKPGMRVLDIGCGWGSFAKYAAEKYGVYVVGITISSEQLELGKELCKGLPIELRFQDYREINEKFDRIVSVGQMEHVGYKNYRLYMEIVANSLNPQGLFLLHTIGSNISSKEVDPWIDKYIFPNGMLPSIVQLAKASEGLFVMEDWHNFGHDYDKTLMAWNQNFENHWNELKSNYNEIFYRMWKFYLLTCAGAFRARQLQLWQIVLSKTGVSGGYKSIR
jgi:cyclopropane-fatty-acyl-phospholipid synthase